MRETANGDAWPLPGVLSNPVMMDKGVRLDLGRPLPLVFFVVRGRLRLAVQLPGAREVWLADLSAGSTIGVVSAVLGERTPATAVVVEPAEARTLTVSRFRALFTSDVRVASWSARALARECQRLELSVARSGASAELRLQYLLAELAAEEPRRPDADAVRLCTSPTQTELANAVGVTREWIGRLLLDFERQNVVLRRNGRYLVPATSPVLALREAVGALPVGDMLARAK